MLLAEATFKDAALLPPLWLIVTVVLCLPATIYVLHRLWHWWLAEEPIPLPEGNAWPASRLPKPYGLVLFGTMYLATFLVTHLYRELAGAGFLPWEDTEGLKPFGPMGFLALTVPAALGLAVVVWFGRGVAGSLCVRLGQVWQGVKEGLLGAGFSIPACVATLIVTSLLFKLFETPVRLHPTLQALERTREPWALVAALVLAGVLAPLAEEFIYRGVLQTSLLKYVQARTALVVSAGLFAGAHFAGEPQAVPSLFLLGLVLGYLAYRTRSLVAPIVCHAAFNGVMLLGHFYGR